MKILPSRNSQLDDPILVGIPLLAVAVAASIHPAQLALRGDWRS